jgi:hypothetical protein
MKTEKAALILRASVTEPQARAVLTAEVTLAEVMAEVAGLTFVGVYVLTEPAGGCRRNLREFLGLIRETPSISVIVSSRLKRVAKNPDEITQLLEVIEEEDRELHLFRSGLIVDRETIWCVPGYTKEELMPDFASLHQARVRLRTRRNSCR